MLSLECNNAGGPFSVSARARHRDDRRRVLGWSVGGVAAALALGVAGRRSAVADAGQRLEGSWLTSFNTVPPTPTPALYRITFYDGGGLTVAYPPLRPQPDGRLLFVTNGVGEWVRTGDHEFACMYLLDVHEVRAEPPLGPRIETHTVWVNLRLNERLDEWEGTWKRQNVDLAGNIVGGLDGRAQAQRLRLTPMP